MSTPAVAPQYHLELIDGREVCKPLPKRNHSRTQGFLVSKLDRDLPGAYEALPEQNVITSGNRVVPDLVVVPLSATFENGDLTGTPLLAIEISSPGQSDDVLIDRCERLIKGGAPLCWLINPDRRQAWHYSVSEGLTEAATALRLSLPEATVEVALAELFAVLDK